MKIILSLAILFTAATTFATTEDACLATLEQKLVTDSANQEWGFDRIVSISKEDAIVDIDGALWDMNDEDTLEKAKVAAQEDGKLFYGIGWTAPSNEGYNVIIADSTTCEVLFDIGVWSQE